MLKKSVNSFVILLTLFYLNCNVVVAYEYQNPNNKTIINDMITQIYDVKDQYEDLVGNYEEQLTINDVTSTLYWWPIGSKETSIVDSKTFAVGNPETTNITSTYGYRDNVYNANGDLVFAAKNHPAIDIANNGSLGTTNIIAAKSGVVVYPNSGDPINCSSGTTASSCGGGYGNYVVIQHPDGNFTLYAHLYENSITVKSGDSVEQGQVIAKMGSSGNSTGAHLHFEIREGSNSSSVAVDPLIYVSAENPRIVSYGTEFTNWLNSWEGSTAIKENNYIVENIGDGVRTVGHGVTLENNISRFKKYNIEIDDYPVGSEITKSIVDQIQLEIIAENKSYVENVLSTNSISLSEFQIQALVSYMYNTGNINGFVNAYNQYANTDSLYENWFLSNINKGTEFETGLTRRRNAEWTLFHSEEYVYNG